MYVFRQGPSWAQEAYVKASQGEANDAFGSSLGLSADGNTLAVGARFEASAASGVGGDQSSNAKLFSGAAYVLRKLGGNWMHDSFVKASYSQQGDNFGIALGLSDNGRTLAVGATGQSSDAVVNYINGDEQNQNAPRSGAGYVYDR